MTVKVTRDSVVQFGSFAKSSLLLSMPVVLDQIAAQASRASIPVAIVTIARVVGIILVMATVTIIISVMTIRMVVVWPIIRIAIAVVRRTEPEVESETRVSRCWSCGCG